MRLFAALGCIFVCGWASAQPVTGSAQPVTSTELPLPQHPAGGVTSVAQADQALLDAKRARIEQEKLFDARRKVCYQKLLAENCLAPQREANNLAMRRIRAVEVEARAFKRNYAARETAVKRAEQNSHAASTAPLREQERAQQRAETQKKIARNKQSVLQFETDAAKRARRATESDKRVRERREARLRKDAEEKAQSAARAERVRAHEKKVADVLRRASEKEENARDKAAKAGAAKVSQDGRP